MNRVEQTWLNGEIETVVGLFYNYLDPKPEQIDWDDVFTGLSQINRYGGQTRYRGGGTRPYSVGEHVLLVTALVAAAGGNSEQQLAALHHDSHEVYLGDLPSPLKRVIKGAAPGVWENLVEGCDSAIRTKLYLPPTAFADPLIKRCDETAMRVEAADLKESRGLGTHWGYTDLPAEIAYFAVGAMTPNPDLIRQRLQERHDALTTGALALAA